MWILSSPPRWITTKNFSVNMRQAAYAVAVDRVVEAMRLRGWV